MGRVLRGSLLSLVTMALVVGVLDVGARALYRPIMVNDTLQADDYLGFRNLTAERVLYDTRGEFTFRTNSLGFRGPELPDERAHPGTERVLLVGDSFVHGWMVREEEWMGSAVRDGLTAAGRVAEVYALCTQDWGTAQELLALRRYGERVSPDHVVLVLYPGNDLANNEMALAGRTLVSANDYFRPYLVPDGDGLALRHVAPWRALLRHSALFRLAERRRNSSRSADDIRIEIAGEPYPSAGERIASGGLPERHLELYLEPSPGDPWDAAWHTTEALILAMRDLARRLGADFQVAVIPQLLEVVETIHTRSYDEQLRVARRKRLASLVDLDLPATRLEEFFHREGLAHVQMLDEFRRLARDSGDPVYASDGHIRGLGHTHLGRAIAACTVTGVDLCAHGGDGPVDLLALRGQPPFELDLEREDCWPFIGPGWSNWIPPASPREYSGWGTSAYGQFAVRAGGYVLRGLLTDRASFPATVLVGTPSDTAQPLARATLEAPGAFELRFDVPMGSRLPGRAWSTLSLALDGALGQAKPGTTPALVLQGLRVEPPSSAK